MKVSMNKKGFTLIEIAIVLAMGGFLFVGLMMAASTYLINSQISETKSKLAKAQVALQQYLELNGKLPCPASLTAEQDTATFGTEVSSSCGGTSAGTFQVSGRGGRDVRIGALPTRTLNINDDDQLDAWGHRFLYAVTIDLTDPDDFDVADGAIGIVDSNDNPVYSPAEQAHYVLLSHGLNGRGAYTLNGKLFKSCTTSSIEGNNCDNSDNLFATTLKRTDDLADDKAFDDFVLFGAFKKPDITATQALPAKTTSAFDLASCPIGWSPSTDIAGRTIVGAGHYDHANRATGEHAAGAWPKYYNVDYPFDVTRYGYDTGSTWGGFNNLKLTLNLIPIHSHGLFSDFRPTSNPAFVGGETQYYNLSGPGSVGTSLYTENNAGGDQPADNRQPFIALLYCEKN